MITLFFDLIFIVFALLYFPLLLVRRKLHRESLMRLGWLSSDLVAKLKERENIWLHAVSVGEVRACSKLIATLREDFPDRPLVITTVTPTGNRVAKSIAREATYVLYSPLDLSFIVKKFISKINPSIFISAETEIWPNLILSLSRKNVPIALVNGRISNRSYKGYSIIKSLLKNILSRIDVFSMQTQSDAKKIISLGAPMDKVEVAGNMKFDVARNTADKRIARNTVDKLGLKKEEKLFIAGSTHSPEEELILGIYKDLLVEFPTLKLLIAPRHIQRTAEIERLIESRGFRPVRFSQLSEGWGSFPAPHLNIVFLLDSIGQLSSLYSLADIVFIGGSLTKKGGHNIIEPAFFSKPILFGPYMFNFQDMAELFLQRKASLQVKDIRGLLQEAKRLLTNLGLRQMLGQRAKQLVEENRGATERNIALIRKLIS